MTDINIGGGLWLVAQVALLVAYYGEFVPTLPWGVVWFPSLLLVAVLALCMLAIFIAVAFL